MDRKELRLGNLILHNGEVEEVAEIGTKDVNEGTCGYIRFEGKMVGSWLTHKGNDLVKPIPLTEEWLRDFDFEDVKPKDGVLMAFIKYSIRIEISHSGNFYYKNKSLPYVHLLQNLYYFNELTGEELTLKNKGKS